MAGKKFPLDNSFDDLRREADALRESLAALRGAAVGGGGGGGAAGAGSGGAPISVQVADNFATSAQKITKSFGDLQKAVTAGGNLAKRLGFDDAAKNAERFAKAMDLAKTSAQGVSAAVNLIGAAWKPVLIAVGAVTGGVLLLRAGIKELTGDSLTLKETLTVAFLQVQQSGADAVRAFGVLVGGISAETLQEFTKISAQASAEGEAIKEEARRRKDQDAREANRQRAALAEQTGAVPLGAKTLLDTAKEQGGLVLDLYGQIAEEVNKLLGFFDETSTKAEKTKTSLQKLSPFENFSLDIERVGDLVTNTFDFIVGAVQQLSATISAAILDAFLDPQADITESFTRLFRSLAQQLLQLLIQAVIVKAVGGIGGASQGGKVGAAHLGGVVGLAAGGFPGLGRPAGIAASDTVPALLTPGEFVNPEPSVSLYGARFFEALRQRMIPKSVTDGIMAGVSVPAPPTVPRFAFASGGPVSQLPIGQVGPSSGVALAVVAPSERHLARQLAEGPDAMVRWHRQNQSRLGRGG